ncbi:hypothetical protein [Streptomyces rimosus]|uniref:hypothetical protein n=1 Tax=Streptomyces rimosus TaxID=1927 RepID=UPI0006C055A3|nr:hypothetical protein [Streptomyces rimosus]KOT47714.1 hypothetical protein ADK43_39555 [Streptomyces rimosus subsp. rimosus]
MLGIGPTNAAQALGQAYSDQLRSGGGFASFAGDIKIPTSTGVSNKHWRNGLRAPAESVHAHDHNAQGALGLATKTYVAHHIAGQRSLDAQRRFEHEICRQTYETLEQECNRTSHGLLTPLSGARGC